MQFTSLRMKYISRVLFIVFPMLLIFMVFFIYFVEPFFNDSLYNFLALLGMGVFILILSMSNIITKFIVPFEKLSHGLAEAQK